ncbi:MAG: DUF3995 domain-containing protein [Hamadaea sp.]|nr:DUF3995 domain-containing protein [Hamadaea sp.]NUT20008.1 DUF3995 domain-containing protein [Hamadaea sp.]
MDRTRWTRRIAACVLGADAVFHVYWLTGATWPAADERALSLAVLGFVVPFSARTLIPLALALSVSAVALWRGTGRVARLIALAVALGTGVQVPLRLAWALGLGRPDAGPVFAWLNVGVYLPLCGFLAVVAFQVARSGTHNWLPRFATRR